MVKKDIQHHYKLTNALINYHKFLIDKKKSQAVRIYQAFTINCR